MIRIHQAINGSNKEGSISVIQGAKLTQNRNLTHQAVFIAHILTGTK